MRFKTVWRCTRPLLASMLTSGSLGKPRIALEFVRVMRRDVWRLMDIMGLMGSISLEADEVRLIAGAGDAGAGEAAAGASFGKNCSVGCRIFSVTLSLFADPPGITRLSIGETPLVCSGFAR
mmetsp:Transcript_20430/g.57814  ORF Transcript_20430/g.57814 Transcript_20430/m.57814 type:complete len:122 (-) Transcript_20430:1167-1532(-)